VTAAGEYRGVFPGRLAHAKGIWRQEY
jgi:hypothetical protein